MNLCQPFRYINGTNFYILYDIYDNKVYLFMISIFIELEIFNVVVSYEIYLNKHVLFIVNSIKD